MNEDSYYKLNAARCKICDTVVVATNWEEKHKCRCGNLIVTGSLSARGLIRYIGQIDYYHEQYEELSQYDTGHPVAEGHAIIKPKSALDEIKPGRCFVQHHIHSPERGWRMLDEYGQSLQAVEIIIGEDGNYFTTVKFRFQPVSGFNFYVCGEISERDVTFFKHVMEDVIPPFIEGGQSKESLYKILIMNGYQDRTGMRDEWRI